MPRTIKLTIGVPGGGGSAAGSNPYARFRAASWYEKQLPVSAPVHSRNTDFLNELRGLYNGSETDGTTAAEFTFSPGTVKQTTLSSAITSTATTCSVASSTGFPAVPFAALTGNGEWITVTAVVGTTWTIIRGISSTTATSHPLNDPLQWGEAFCQFIGGFGGQTAVTFDTPLYRVTTADTSYTVYDGNGTPYVVPERFRSAAQGGTDEGLRLPEGAKEHFSGATSSDSPLKVYDVQRGYYAHLGKAFWTGTRWEILVGGGAGISMLSSYGVDSGDKVASTTSHPSQWPATMTGTGVNPDTYQDNTENQGPRGLHAGYTFADFNRVRDEGIMAYVVEGFCTRTLNCTSATYRFPMSSSELNKGGLIPEGTRMRIKTTVNVTVRLANKAATDGWSAQRLAENTAIAKGLQAYGLWWGDNAGGGSCMKLEAMQREYPKASPPTGVNNWAAQKNDLEEFPFASDWEFIADNYDPVYVAP